MTGAKVQQLVAKTLYCPAFRHPSMTLHNYTTTSTESCVFFDALGLHPRLINGLHHHYLMMRRANPDAQEDWAESSFLMYFDLEKDHAFNRFFYKIMDTSGDGSVSFEEFVLTTSSFCLAYDLEDFLDFSLKLFDWSSEGTITIPDFELALKRIYGPDYSRNFKAKLAFDNFLTYTERANGRMDRRQLEHFMRCHPNIMHPLFELQRTIQQKLYGPSFWHSYSAYRKALKPLNVNKFEPHELHTALLQYKCKTVSAVLTNTGNDSAAIRDNFAELAAAEAQELMAEMVDTFGTDTQGIDPLLRGKLASLQTSLPSEAFQKKDRKYHGLKGEMKRLAAALSGKAWHAGKKLADAGRTLATPAGDQLADHVLDVVHGKDEGKQEAKVLRHPLESIMLECHVCDAESSAKYVRRLRETGHDSVWALKSVRNADGLRDLGVDNKIDRLRLWRLLREPGAIPDASLPTHDFVRRVLHVREGKAKAYCSALVEIGLDTGESFLAYADVQRDLDSIEGLLPGHKGALQAVVEEWRQGRETHRQQQQHVTPPPSRGTNADTRPATVEQFLPPPDRPLSGTRGHSPSLVTLSDSQALQSGSIPAPASEQLFTKRRQSSLRSIGRFSQSTSQGLAVVATAETHDVSTTELAWPHPTQPDDNPANLMFERQCETGSGTARPQRRASTAPAPTVIAMMATGTHMPSQARAQTAGSVESAAGRPNTRRERSRRSRRRH